ncbi:MAG: hypothetical protein D3917_02665 [Candidatus Electrothrix sp. AX5]|nr:hypothetical protein [Candidatus Electrothrix sp. AX5]
MHRDPRVRRQLFALRDEFQVTAAGLTDPEIEEVQFVKIGAVAQKRFVPKWINIHINIWARRFRFYNYPFWKSGKFYDYIKLCWKRYDFIIANDELTLPLVFMLPGRHKIMVDMHEYFPDYYAYRKDQCGFLQEEITQRCLKYLPKADVVTTVCEGLAQRYKNEICHRDIHVIKNVAPFYDLDPALIKNKVRIIYHGSDAPIRNVHTHILAMDEADDRYYLDLMLVHAGDMDYRDKLEEMAKVRENVTIIPPVSTEEIIPFTHAYDIGLFLLKPMNTNYEFALPNKLFEFIQARLAVIIGPSVEMAKIVNKYQCGRVAENFNSTTCAALLNSLTNEDIFQMKKQSSVAAVQENFEQERGKLLSLIKS